MSTALILDKKSIQHFGSKMVESSSSKPSSYAMKLMEKMGWKEGQGLGKSESGMVEHIKITKRDDNMGLGHDIVVKGQESISDSWWNKAFSSNLASFSAAIGGTRKKKSEKKQKKEKEEGSKKRKRSSSSDDSSSSSSEDDDDVSPRSFPSSSSLSTMEEPSLEDLFILTGGKTFGMRSRREQRGKVRRTESDNALYAKLEEYQTKEKQRKSLKQNEKDESNTNSSSKNGDTDDDSEVSVEVDLKNKQKEKAAKKEKKQQEKREESEQQQDQQPVTEADADEELTEATQSKKEKKAKKERKQKKDKKEKSDNN
jgi:hypothetical protein